MSSPEGSSVTFRRPLAGVRARAIQMFARKLQVEIGKGRPFDTLITGDSELAGLNRQYRGKPYPTDVLSFPSATKNFLGDLAISAARARAQAKEFGHSLEDEIRILMLHGVLHLSGMDHETDRGAMARAEARWRARLGLPNGLIERVRS